MRYILRGRSRNKAYYCKALSGLSSYNICINCDLTVSCNCQDYNGDGQIGDLNVTSLEEIFRGGRAQAFRQKLAEGELPLSTCQHCVELVAVSAREARHYLKRFDLPRKGIMVENTIRCNLRCLYCARGKTLEIRRQKQITLEQTEKVAKLLKQHNIAQVCYFNLGEPFLSNNIYQEITLIRKYNPDIAIYLSTNGMLIDNEAKVEAALMLDHIFFSIDGPSQEVLGKYQVGGSFEQAFANMNRVITARNARSLHTPIIEWKYVVFAWNDHDEHINRAINLAEAAGVDLISFVQGGGSAENFSTRYANSAFFSSLGEVSERGREVWFTKNRGHVSMKASP